MRAELVEKGHITCVMLPLLYPRSAVHGMIAFTNLVNMENEDWLMQLHFLFVNFAMAGLLGAAFNSLRMWLWRLRASKTLHLQRIAEVRR